MNNAESLQLLARIDERVKSIVDTNLKTVLANSEEHKKLFIRIEQVHSQTTKTNGRVTKLEKWKWYIMGASASIVLVFTVAISVYNMLK